MQHKIDIARKIAEQIHLEPNKKYPKGQKDKNILKKISSYFLIHF